MESFNTYLLLCMGGALFGGAIVLSITRSLSGMYYPQYGHPMAPSSFDEIHENRNSMNTMAGFFMIVLMGFVILLAFRYLQDKVDEKKEVPIEVSVKEEYERSSKSRSRGVMDQMYYRNRTDVYANEEEARDPYQKEKWSTDYAYEVEADWENRTQDSAASNSDDFWGPDEEELEQEGFYLQIYSFSSYDKANMERNDWKKNTDLAVDIGMIEDDLSIGANYKVLLGPFNTVEKAEGLRRSLKIKGSYVVASTEIEIIRP